jgi:type II secretory pathway predicted ATPase ExeA
MFEQFFGFTKTPFGRDLESKELYSSQGQQELISRLKYVAGRRQFGLFTGEVGSGKSTAARVLVTELNPAKYQVTLNYPLGIFIGKHYTSLDKKRDFIGETPNASCIG